MVALVADLLLGAGLTVSGMANPVKVLGFFNLFDQQDPSLTFTMAGATVVGVIAFFVACRRGRSWLGAPIQSPLATGMTTRLVLGSAVFDIGWGPVGFCPGSAPVALSADMSKAVGFVAAMLADAAVLSWLQRKRQMGGSATNKPITHLQKTT